jgi:hypothetical protein
LHDGVIELQPCACDISGIGHPWSPINAILWARACHRAPSCSCTSRFTDCLPGLMFDFAPVNCARIDRSRAYMGVQANMDVRQIDLELEEIACLRSSDVMQFLMAKTKDGFKARAKFFSCPSPADPLKRRKQALNFRAPVAWHWQWPCYSFLELHSLHTGPCH